MKKRLQNLRITSLLVGMVTLLVTAALVISVTLFASRYREATIQNARTTGAQAVSQLAGTLGRYIEDINSNMTLITNAMAQDEEERDAFFSALLSVQPEIIAVTSYDADGALLNCWAAGHEPKESIYQNLSFDTTVGQGAQGRILSVPHVESIFEGYYPWVVTIAEPLQAAGGARWVALDLSFTAIATSINTVGVGQHGYCFVMDQSGSMIYHPQQQLLYAGLRTEDTDRLATLADGTYADDTIIYSLQTVEGSHWRVVGVSYIDELVNQNVSQMVRGSLAIAAAMLLTALLAGLVLSRVLTRPLQQLQAGMQQFERDAEHFTYQPIGRTREVRELSASFGHMVVRVQQLMSTVREEEVNLRKTELKALQAQINPHFLYNTLDSIAWMCERGKNADAVQMVHALARLFRISISRGHELIPIAKEIEHAESYLQIQMYRYKNQFTYHFEVDPACTDYLCNKITLQPIIENSINHGLDMLVEPGHIEVEVKQDGEDIIFRVTDDGVGMAAEQVEAMMHREPSDRTGIGIKNVNDRLRIYFGENYGLTINSVPDEGTTVTIRMPKIKEGDYDETR